MENKNCGEYQQRGAGYMTGHRQTTDTSLILTNNLWMTQAKTRKLWQTPAVPVSVNMSQKRISSLRLNHYDRCVLVIS